MIEALAVGVLNFHNIDPVIVSWGPFALRWYSLGYIGGLFYAWWKLAKMSAAKDSPYKKIDADDYLIWATLGIILGGRLGYVLFYNFEFYLANPGAILQVWEGGMSFHGGFLGVVVATIIFVRRRGIPFLQFADRMAIVSPVGLFLVRVANFINGELWGAPSNLPWAMYFPRGGDIARHPTQLYEAALEGILLFIIVNYLFSRTNARKYPGMIAGVFVLGYGTARYAVEFVREPDAHLGLIWNAISMGQILSLPMMIVGAIVIIMAAKKKKTV